MATRKNKKKLTKEHLMMIRRKILYQELDLLYEALQCKLYEDEQVMLKKNDRLDQLLKEILDDAKARSLYGSK